MATHYRIHPSTITCVIAALVMMVLFSACFGGSKKTQHSQQTTQKQITTKRQGRVIPRTPTPVVQSPTPNWNESEVQQEQPPTPYPPIQQEKPNPPAKEVVYTQEKSETWEKPNLPQPPPTPKGTLPTPESPLPDEQTLETDDITTPDITSTPTTDTHPDSPDTDWSAEKEELPVTVAESPSTTPPIDEETTAANEPVNSEAPIYEPENEALSPPDDYTPPPTAPLLPTYDIAVFLPFNLQNYPDGFEQTDLSKKTKLAVEFYEGILIGLDDLASRSQININVQVFDTQKSEAEVQQILANGNLYDVDLIIGPIYNAPLKAVANFAQQYQIHQVSPLSPSTRVTTNNPYYLMASPPIETHLAAIYDYVRKSYHNNQRLITVSDNNAKEINLAQSLHNYANTTTQNGEGFGYANIQHVVYGTSNNPNDLEFYLSPNEENIIVVTSFNELFINKLLVNLLPLRHRYPITLFGMPNWKNMKTLEIDYLSKLNYHTTTHFWKDINSIAQKEFNRVYEERYQRQPSQYASTGYDITTYFGKLMKAYGRNLGWYLEEVDPEGVFSNFDFKAGSAAQYQNQTFSLDYYENKSVHILKYDNFIFKKVN